MCVAPNKAGIAKRAVVLLVELPPPNSMALKKRPLDRCIKPGHTAVFSCQVGSLTLTRLEGGGLGQKFSLEYASAALLDPARRGKILFDCHPDVRLRVK